MLEALAQEFVIREKELRKRVTNGRTYDDLYRQADLAMYCAKREGRDTFRIYTNSMQADAHEYVATVNGLRRALEKQELVLHYQPQIHLATGEVRGVEALIRWERPGYGLVPPGKFISIGEDSGLIVEVGNGVIQEVCRQGCGMEKDWRAKNAHCVQPLRSSTAPRGARNASCRRIAGISIRTRPPGTGLTESVLVYNNADVAAYLELLKGLGIGIALDDFGTGYSNFTYLRYFDLDRLKIDQSFVRGLTPKNKGDVAIIRSIVQLARNFGLETIAEGVETEEALKVVRRAGCDFAQGFLFAKPMPAPAVPIFISEQGFPHNYCQMGSSTPPRLPASRIQ